MALKENNLTYTCPNCGGPLSFDINAQKVTCSHCGAEFDVNELKEFKKEVEKNKQEEVKWEDKQEQFSKKELDELAVYYCSNCGGNLITDKNTTSTVCPYCGSPVIIGERLKGVLKPDYVIPFKQDKTAVYDLFNKYLKKKLFIKSSFIKEAGIEKLNGLYAPYWLFSADVTGSARFKGYIIRTWMDSNYYYTEKKFYAIFRGGGLQFDHVPHDASKSIPDELLESVEPYKFADAKDFTTDYLVGHAADKYDVTAQECEEHVNDRMRQTMVDEFKKTVIGYSGVILEDSCMKLHNNKVNYALYPVWLFNSTYKEKKYSFAMNGFTGKTTGNLPMSFWKFIVWFLGFFAVTGAIAFGITYAIIQELPWYIWLISAGVGLITPLIFCIYHALKLKPVKKAKNAADYVTPGSVFVDYKKSVFLYRTVTRTARVKNNH